VTGAGYKDIDVIRANQRKYNDPRTPSQINQRQKFAFVHDFLQPIKEFADNWSGQDPAKVKRNPALSYHLKPAVNGTYPNFELHDEREIITRGELPGAINALVERESANKLKLCWFDNSGYGIATEADRLLIVLYDPTSHETAYFGEATRG